MAKTLKLNVGNYFLEKIKKPIRTKEDIIILLLETIKMFLVGNVICDNESNGKVIIKVDKMSRLIYEIENKCFSFNFPFSVDNTEVTKFYDSVIGIDIDSKVISILLGIFNDEVIKNDSLEEIYYELAYIEGIPEIENIWRLVRKLMLFESGYLRYDYDLERADGKLHPLHHFDIYFSASNSFKVGLNDKVGIEEFMDILDLQTDCYYLDKK